MEISGKKRRKRIPDTQRIARTKCPGDVIGAAIKIAKIAQASNLVVSHFENHPRDGGGPI